MNTKQITFSILTALTLIGCPADDGPADDTMSTGDTTGDGDGDPAGDGDGDPGDGDGDDPPVRTGRYMLPFCPQDIVFLDQEEQLPFSQAWLLLVGPELDFAGALNLGWSIMNVGGRMIMPGDSYIMHFFETGWFQGANGETKAYAGGLGTVACEDANPTNQVQDPYGYPGDPTVVTLMHLGIAFGIIDGVNIPYVQGDAQLDILGTKYHPEAIREPCDALIQNQNMGWVEQGKVFAIGGESGFEIDEKPPVLMGGMLVAQTGLAWLHEQFVTFRKNRNFDGSHGEPRDPTLIEDTADQYHWNVLCAEGSQILCENGLPVISVACDQPLPPMTPQVQAAYNHLQDRRAEIIESFQQERRDQIEETIELKEAGQYPPESPANNDEHSGVQVSAAGKVSSR